MKKLLMGLLSIFISESYADTETITWYVDGDAYTTTTCETGGDITLQTAPAKRGYTFTGWQVPLYDFSTLDPSIGGVSFKSNRANMTWSVAFPYGQVSGSALCSVTSGPYAVVGIPDESTGEGQYCWCKATGYTPINSNIAHENISSSGWVYRFAFNDSASDCALSCASECAYGAYAGSSIHQALFGVTQ